MMAVLQHFILIAFPLIDHRRLGPRGNVVIYAPPCWLGNEGTIPLVKWQVEPWGSEVVNSVNNRVTHS